MDLNGIYLNYGTQVAAGYTKMHWRHDGVLERVEVFADNTRQDLIYTKSFCWNSDGTLKEWTLTVVTTGERITKTFHWGCDGDLISSEVTTC